MEMSTEGIKKCQYLIVRIFFLNNWVGIYVGSIQIIFLLSDHINRQQTPGKVEVTLEGIFMDSVFMHLI